MPNPRKSLSISRLHLDPQNPRVGRSVKNEAGALERLLDRFGDQILALARDISDHGLDPTQSWAVVKESNRFIVLEGNRRLVACRLLLDPKKAPTEQWARRFQRIEVAIGSNEISKPSCVIFNSRAEGRHWIQLKHHGAKNGAGTVSWGPEMVYLDSIANGGRKQEWNEFWFWLEETYHGDFELSGLIAAARSSQYTTMERLYNWELRNKLNASIDTSGHFFCAVDPDRVKPFLQLLMTGMVTKGDTFLVDSITEELPSVSSRTANDQDDTRAVINELWKHTVADADVSVQPMDATSANQQDASGPSSSDNTSEVADPADNTATAGNNGKTGAKRGNTRPLRAETHLYAGVTPRSGLPGRLKGLLTECSKIEVDSNPEVAAVMSRIALELTADALIEKHSIKVPSKNPKSVTLQEKLKAVLNHLDPTYNAAHPNLRELRGVWSAIRTDEVDTGHLVKDLNDSVHDYKFTAALDIARRANKILTPFMKAMVNDIRQK